MKNNFDFIKEKFDNDGVNAPAEINADFVMSKIENKEQKRVPFPAKRIVAGISSFVACVAVFAIIITSTKTPAPMTPAPMTVSAGELKTFDSYESVKKTLKAMDIRGPLTFEFQNFNVKGSIDEATTDTAISDQVYGKTYTQVEDVDEADIIKTDGKNIYYVSNNAPTKLLVFSANGKNSKHINNISVKGIISDIYLNGDRVIINSNDYETQITHTDIFNKADIDDIKKEQSYEQSGSYLSSRMIGTDLFVVSNQYIQTHNDIPNVNCNGKEARLNPKCITCVENPSEPAYLVVTKIDTVDKNTKSETKAILGASNIVYCSKNNMYVTSTVYEEILKKEKTTKEETTAANDSVIVGTIDEDTDVAMPSQVIYNDKTQIIKIDLTDGIKFVATSKIDGRVYDQYALDEKDGNLRIATTSVNEKGEDINNMFVLNEKLEQIGKVEGFAPTESIKAVKYVGDTAYLITYEQTDPLFIIDLSNPSKPAILGECKIEGFSTMLVPVGDDKLLGIGYYTEESAEVDMEVTEGIKLALFDISDKKNPKVIDEKVFKGYTSVTQHEPKSFVYNSEKDVYIIPYEKFNYDDYDNSETGALCFGIKDNQITKSTKYKINSNEYTTCDRVTYINNDLYMLTIDDKIFSSQIK